MEKGKEMCQVAAFTCHGACFVVTAVSYGLTTLLNNPKAPPTPLVAKGTAAQYEATEHVVLGFLYSTGSVLD